MGDNNDNDHDNALMFANKAQIFQYTLTHSHTNSLIKRLAFYRPLGMVLFN